MKLKSSPRLLVASVFTLVIVAGCTPVTVESSWQADGIKTAAFDLQCTDDKIQMTVLTRNDGLGCFGSKVGARGCGKQTTYECDNARTWHRSSEVSALDAK